MVNRFLRRLCFSEYCIQLQVVVSECYSFNMLILFVQEILLPLFFLFWLILLSMMYPNKKYDEVPDSDLYSVDHSSISEFVVGYTPVNNVTRKIMHKMSAEYFTEGIISKLFCSPICL